MIDLDRLHDVFLHNYVSDENYGKTYASCFELLGAIGLGDVNIFYIVNTHRDINFVIRMFVNILQEYNYDFFQNTSNVIKVNKSIISFIVREYSDKKLQGMCNYTIVEMESIL